MTQKTLNLELSNDQFADLTNALEDHREYFKKPFPAKPSWAST